ncbi:MAG TPA: transcription antitermination factor NusB [Microbacteriaceae bacterium]|nr:transcription antitermination factor NusB [Microbacteriaceae bacterium]
MNAREVAWELLTAVDEREAYANLEMPALLRRARLSPRDAGFATELGYGCLRMRGFVDAVLELVLPRRIDELDPAVLRVLELGVYQLLVLDTEPHAAVSESVELSRRVGAARASGFINANLRRVSERSRPQWEMAILNRFDELAARAALTSHPEWIVEELDVASQATTSDHDIDAVLAANNANPAVNFVALPGVAQDDSTRMPNRFSPVGFQAGRGDPRRVTAAPGVRVQDEGSQLAALALSRFRAAKPGERWLDMCAGPGGKAALLAAEAMRSGAHLLANEVSDHRAKLVEQALLPLGADTSVIVGDARRFADEPDSFDRILLDAPCSGLGALRRRPEARWRKHPDDISELASLQTELLGAGLRALSPGGVLAYVTCSPVLRETRDVVGAVLGDDVRLLDTAEVLDGIACEPLNARVEFAGQSGSAVQLWPHLHETDAMFIALLERT